MNVFRPVIVATLIGTLVLAPISARVAAADCKLGTSGEPCRTPWLDEGAELRALQGSPPGPASAPIEPADESPRPSRHRVRSLAITAGLYAGFIVWADLAWYRGKIDHGFRWGHDGYFGRNTYAGGADKLGHAWANLVLGRATSRVLRKGGWSDTSSGILGGTLAWTMFVFVELKDGYAYNFSTGDMAFNTIGAIMGALQEISPRFDELVDYRVAYAPSDEYIGLWEGTYYGTHKGNSLNIAEDYSGQTYYLALHLGALPKARSAPRPLALALEYLDLGVAFETRRYKPDAPPEAIPTQQLFLGATLDLQRVMDKALRKQRITRKITHGVLEVMSPPYTIVPVVGGRRSATGPAPDQ